MGKYVLKVARKGYNVFTADDRFLTIDSTKNQFKVKTEVEGTAAFGSSADEGVAQSITVDIEHNLGYQPTFLFYAQTPDGKVRLSPYIGTGSTGPTNVTTGTARVNDNILRLYFYVWDPTLDAYDAFDVNYKCLIYTDPNKDA